MRTATPNIIILSAQVTDTSINGTAIDGDILVNFAVAKTDVNQRLFVPEANLIVTGKFRLATTIGTIGMWITSVIAVVSIPAPTEIEPVITLTPAQKRAATIAANKTKADAAVVVISC